MNVFHQRLPSAGTLLSDRTRAVEPGAIREPSAESARFLCVLNRALDDNPKAPLHKQEEDTHPVSSSDDPNEPATPVHRQPAKLAEGRASTSPSEAKPEEETEKSGYNRPQETKPGDSTAIIPALVCLPDPPIPTLVAAALPKELPAITAQVWDGPSPAPTNATPTTTESAGKLASQTLPIKGLNPTTNTHLPAPPVTPAPGSSPPASNSPPAPMLLPLAADGTSDAQTPKQMKECLNQDEFAVHAELFAAHAESGDTLSLVHSPDSIQLASAYDEFKPSRDSALLSDAATAIPSLEAPSWSDGMPEEVAAMDLQKPFQVTRLFHDMVREAAIVRHSQADSLAVVLKPDTQTELYLHLSFRDGQVEASARCDRGDFHFLNFHWSELQRELEHQGIRLLDLHQRIEDAGQHFEAGFSGFFRQNRQNNTEPEELGLAGFSARAGSSKTARVTAARLTVTTNRLLESWA